MPDSTTPRPNVPDEAEPCGENMCHCHCGGTHVCGCDCWRCDWCGQNEDHCYCGDEAR